MKKTKLFLLTLCIVTALCFAVSCGEDNNADGSNTKPTPSATQNVSDTTAGETNSDGNTAGTTGQTAKPTMNEEDFGVEDFLPTPPPATGTFAPTNPDDPTTEVPSNGIDATTTEAPTTDSGTSSTATPTQQPTQPTLPVKTGIELPPIWF